MVLGGGGSGGVDGIGFGKQHTETKKWRDRKHDFLRATAYIIISFDIRGKQNRSTVERITCHNIA